MPQKKRMKPSEMFPPDKTAVSHGATASEKAQAHRTAARTALNYEPPYPFGSGAHTLLREGANRDYARNTKAAEQHESTASKNIERMKKTAGLKKK